MRVSKTWNPRSSLVSILELSYDLNDLGVPEFSETSKYHQQLLIGAPHGSSRAYRCDSLAFPGPSPCNSHGFPQPLFGRFSKWVFPKTMISILEWSNFWNGLNFGRFRSSPLVASLQVPPTSTSRGV